MNDKPNSKPVSPQFRDVAPNAPDNGTSPPEPAHAPGSSPDTLQDAMLLDRHRLSRQRKRLDRDRYQALLRESIELRRRREQSAIRLDYPADLPITTHREQLISLIRDHQVVIVCGETGSGKSTQLPKICWEAGLGRAAMIGHTQPRRLAARSIATRLAEELQCELGRDVGYQIRFGDQTSDETLIKLMTDGILLAETQSDRQLYRYDCIIIDEAHERSLNIDFLLGYLARLREERNDLRIVITSATIDAERFAEHFADAGGPAPIVTVQGRSYPVEVRYLPWEDLRNEGGSREYDLARHVIGGIESLGSLRGDVLVFLPTERDIREVSHRVAGHYKQLGLGQRFDLLPLYARLPTSEQQRIFQVSGSKVRIIFATNVAESSLTVPGIHYVIDCGTARMSRYSARSKLQRLPIEPVSQASANQRAGRCGRIGPGICVRLYAAADYDSRDAYTTPEIRRTNLASAVLQMKTLGLGQLEDFPLLDPPRPELIREGVRTLVELGAIDARHELTAIGRRLGRLPVDPRVGRILLAAEEHGVLPEILPIAAAIEIPDPRDRPPDQRQAADQAHAAFTDSRSDFLGFLRLWRFHESAKVEHSRSKLTRVLKKHFLSPTRMREWYDVYRQLKQVMLTSDERGESKKTRIGAPRFSDEDSELIDPDRSTAIHTALLTGLLHGVAMRGDKSEYTGAGGLKLFLWPGSGIASEKPKWIVAAELVETSRQYARVAAQIQPAWVEQVAAHLVKRSHSDPHWNMKSGGAFCYEQQTLFGLPIVTRRRMPLAPIDPGTARDLLIERGLVDGELVTSARSVAHNRKLCELIAGLAAKTRRRDWVVDPYRLQQFYQTRLPEQVCDRARLEKYDRAVEAPAWTRQLRTDADVAQWMSAPPPAEPEETLYLRPDDILDIDAAPLTTEDFPDELEVGPARLPLEYRFEPGAESDGINLRIHQAAVNQVTDDRLGWLVPGLLHAKLVAMIKSLPKRIRRNMVPAADVARRIAEELMPVYGQVPFLTAVCQAMSRHAEMPVTPADFQSEKLEPHLQFYVTVVDDAGKTVAQGREIEPLREQLGVAQTMVEPASDLASEDWQRASMKTFDIEQLPAQTVRQRGGVQVALFPGLVDENESVSTRLFSDAETAEASLRRGLVRLFAIRERRELRSQVRWLPSLAPSRVKLSVVIATQRLEEDLADLIARLAFVEDQPTIRTQAEFESRAQNGARKIGEATQKVEPWLAAVSDAVFAAQRELESTPASRHAAAITDVRAQVRDLTPPGFLTAVPWRWLEHYPRYFKAIAYRLERIRSGAAGRDSESAAIVEKLWNQWLAAKIETDRDPLQLAGQEFRWLIEELRVSLFAQPLGTAVKVSPQRLEKLL